MAITTDEAWLEDRDSPFSFRSSSPRDTSEFLAAGSMLKVPTTTYLSFPRPLALPPAPYAACSLLPAARVSL